MLKHVLTTSILAGLVVCVAALAHAKLESSAPAPNTQLIEVPKTLTLHFSEEATLAMLTLSVDGKEVPIALDRAVKASSIIAVPLPTLAPGRYQVRWSALAADDGHLTKGTFFFTVVAAKPSR